MASNTSNSASAANSTKEPTPGDEPAAGDAAATGALASRAKQALDAWQALESALANVSLHAQVFADVASAVDRQIATEAEIRKKDGRIAELDSTIQNQLGALEARYSKWEVEKKELEEKIGRKETASDARLKDVLAKKNAAHVLELDKWKKALEGERKKSAALEGRLVDADLRIKKAEEGLAKCSKEINEWNGYMSQLKEVDFKKFDAKIKPLSERCCTIAHKYFFSDLPERFFLDTAQWDELTDSLAVPLFFPPSNSQVAKNVRMAAFLHITARALCTEIFKPCYTPFSTHFSDGFKEILAMQFRADVSKERITRALVLSTFDDPKEDFIDETIKKTVTGAVTRIANLLAPLVADEGFASELLGLFWDAADVWRGMAQYSIKMVEALTANDFPNLPWATLDQFTISPPPSATTISSPGGHGASSHVEMLNLFPLIYVPEDEKVVFSGIALLSSQGIAAAAEKEATEFVLARKPKTTWGSAGATGNAFSGGGGKRRMSSFSEGKGRFPTLAALAATAGGEEGIQQRGQGGSKNGKN